MKCDKCKGTGFEERLVGSWPGETRELHDCGYCNGTGELTKGQKIEYKLRDMEMHDYMNISSDCRVLRVVGGWIYEYYSIASGETLRVVFVKEVKR